MKEQSKRMLEAGWVLVQMSPERWKAISPENNEFIWEKGCWNPEESKVQQELAQNETAIREGRYSAFTGTSRLSAPANSPQAGLLTQWLARKGHVKGNTVLRARVCPDPVGDELLYTAGARRVETLLQPWEEPPHRTTHFSSHLLICEHVADVLPKKEREQTLKRITRHLHKEAEAYFSFYQLDALPVDRPHESSGDGYIFTHGPHSLFLKPSLPGQCAPAIQKMLGGFAEEVEFLYNTIFCRWLPHE